MKRLFAALLLLVIVAGCSGSFGRKTESYNDAWIPVAEPAICTIQCIKNHHCAKMEKNGQYYEACIHDSLTIQKLFQECSGSLHAVIHKSVINSNADDGKIVLGITHNVPFWECGKAEQGP